MAKKRRRVKLNDDRHFAMSCQLEKVTDALKTVRDLLYDHMEGSWPPRVKNAPGVLSLALEEIERVHASWDGIVIPQKQDQPPASGPAVDVRGPTLVVDNTR